MAEALSQPRVRRSVGWFTPCLQNRSADLARNRNLKKAKDDATDRDDGGYRQMAPGRDIAWAKLKSVVEGAALASKHD